MTERDKQSTWGGKAKSLRSVADIQSARNGTASRDADEFVVAVLEDMRERRNELNVGEGTYEMANVRPDRTGLPFTVYISEKGNARHAARVKIASGPKATEFVASVSVAPPVELMAGDLSPADLALVRQWIEKNRDVLMGYWNGDIQYTEDALARLTAI